MTQFKCNKECLNKEPACFMVIKDEDNFEYLCTRTKDHEGPHSACGIGHHDMVIQEQDNDN